MGGHYNTFVRIASGTLAAVLVASAALAQQQWGAGWTIPEGAETRQSPKPSSPALLKQGRSLFERSCQKCHGPQGKGDGSDSDPQSPAADLTDPFRAELNPEGVMFYRVMNGKPPVMPAFKSQLSADEVWAVVAYARSLRKSP
jgi:mono/diheme cytochrome c family protein